MVVTVESILTRSIRLRRQHRFDAALELIERYIAFVDPAYHPTIWLEAFYAAQAKGEKQLASAYARKVAHHFPHIPGVHHYLQS